MVQEERPKTVYWLENKLYLNITNKCSNNCTFCIRHFKKGVGGFCLRLEREPTSDQIISELKEVIFRRNWEEIVFCGFGEPTERLDCLLEVSRWIRQNYRRPVKIRVNTNGQGLLINSGRDVPNELKSAGVDKVSVSLNAGGKEVYQEICRPKFENAFDAVLDFILKAKKELEVEVTAVTIPEVDLQEIKATAEKMGLKLRLRQYIPCFW